MLPADAILRFRLTDDDIELLVDLHTFAERIFVGKQRAWRFPSPSTHTLSDARQIVVGDETAAGQLQIGQLQVFGRAADQADVVACDRDSRPRLRISRIGTRLQQRWEYWSRCAR